MLKISQLDTTLREEILEALARPAGYRKMEFRTAITKLVEDYLEAWVAEEVQNTQAYKDYAKLEREQWDPLSIDLKQGRQESNKRDKLNEQLAALETDFEAYRTQLEKDLEPLKIEIIEELMK